MQVFTFLMYFDYKMYIFVEFEFPCGKLSFPRFRHENHDHRPLLFIYRSDTRIRIINLQNNNLSLRNILCVFILTFD